MAAVNFGYSDKTGEWHAVTTLEEDEYPTYYNQSRRQDSSPNDASDDKPPQQKTPPAPAPAESPKPPALFEGHREFQENQRGVSYETLLLPYLRGATEITIVDPYIRLPHQGPQPRRPPQSARLREGPCRRDLGEPRDEGRHR